MSVAVNGKQVDLSNALPLTLGDLKALKKIGVTLPQINFIDNPEGGGTFVHYVLHKANPEISVEDVDTLSIRQLIAISKTIDQSEGDLDVPFSTTSIVSAEPTVGPNET